MHEIKHSDLKTRDLISYKRGEALPISVSVKDPEGISDVVVFLILFHLQNDCCLLNMIRLREPIKREDIFLKSFQEVKGR